MKNSYKFSVSVDEYIYNRLMTLRGRYSLSSYVRNIIDEYIRFEDMKLQWNDDVEEPIDDKQIYFDDVDLSKIKK